MKIQPIRVLVIEDLADDAELMILKLRQDGFEPDWLRVEEQEGFLKALGSPFDLVLADYTLPKFSGLKALALLKEHDLDIPLIIVSGTVGEEVAVEAIKLGAYDYVLKGKLARLAASVRNALKEKHQRDDTVPAELALRDSEVRFRKLIENAPDAFFLYDSNGRLKYASPSTQRILGYSSAEILGSDPAQATHPDDLPGLLALLADLIQNPEQVVTTKYRYKHKDGTWRWLESTITNLLNEPSVQAMVFNYRDFTERRQAEDDLRKTEEKYRILVEQLPAITYLDVRGEGVQRGEFTTVYLSPQVEKLLGYDPDRFYSDPTLWTQLIHPDQRQQVMADHTEHYTTQKPYHGEYRMLKQDGSAIWVRDESVVVKGEDGTVFSQGVVFDITERKQAEEALRQSEERYRLLFESNPLPMWVYDLDTLAFLAVNAATVDHYGYERAEFLSMTIRDIRPPQELAEPDADRVSSGQTTEKSGTWRHRKKDGTFIDVEIVSHEIVFGSRPARLVLAKDVTERKRHEGELEAIAKVSAALRKAGTRAEMLPIILDQLIDLLKVDAASLAMLDPVNGETVIELARGAWSSGTGRRIPAGEGISGQVIATGRPYVNNDIDSDPRYIPPIADQKLSAAACVPLKAQEQTIGALWIGRGTVISTIEVHLLTAISNIAASAIQRTTLFEQTQRRLQQISALHSIDIAISSSFDLRFTLNILLEQVSSHLGVDATDVLLLNPHTQMLEHVAGRGFHSSAVERLKLRLGEGQAGRAALERRIISIPNLLSDTGRLERAEFIASEKFVSFYGVPLIAKGQIKGVLEIFHRSPLNPDPDWLNFLQTLAEQAAIAINDATMFDNLQRSNTELILAYDATIEGWSRALDLRDNETEGHTQRVTATTLKLARIMMLSETELINMRRGALLHDIGKMGIPDSILLKPDQLTSEEWVIMRKHPEYAYELIRPIEFLRPSVDIPYCHHEKWDGTGYPRGLKAEHIPLAARIFSLADVWDALLSDRPYRKAWLKPKARDYIISENGKHFDPAIVRVFLTMEESE